MFRVRAQNGSSPHPWGIPMALESEEKPFRFIPTSVGNTTPCETSCCRFPVHPHIRGEYVRICLWSFWLHGSSPHPWGIPDVERSSLAWVRFIPTSVGNTEACGGFVKELAVHPHIRGEYGAQVPQGSQDWRFIPTSVGNTKNNQEGSHSKSVHPHIRGEYISPPDLLASVSGSSPHPWGIHMVHRLGKDC